jgi:hypothetical protein
MLVYAEKNMLAFIQLCHVQERKEKSCGKLYWENFFKKVKSKVFITQTRVMSV